MSVERHPLFLLFSVRLRLNAFLMPQNALPEFPGCHGTASDPKEKADQINPCSNRKAVAKPPAKCQTKKKRRHKGQSELCQHCEIGNHPRPLLHILSLSAASFCQTLGSVSCFIFPKTHFHFCNHLVRLYHKRFHKTNEFVYFPMQNCSVHLASYFLKKTAVLFHTYCRFFFPTGKLIAYLIVSRLQQVSAVFF